MARYTSSSSDVDSSSSDEDLAYVTDLNSTYHTSQGRGIMPYRFEPEKLAASADGDHQDREQEERLPDSCEWCSCGHCLAMPDDPNNRFCCKEMNALQCAFDTSLEELGMEISCITDHPGFAQACLSVYALKVAYLNYRTQYGKINKPQNQ
ncbi:hypothetical protein BaRGS_00024155 [Batillaria attramentaria]|uniref:Uncharacterized protein n=1 Tax=Batillaria attramentaria TaxID=370345 RepID=A0ABD0KBW5_9CAEN